MAFWSALTVLNVGYVGLFGANLPYVDDFHLLTVLSGYHPATWEWFWHETVNEHRFPVARALMLGLARLSGNDVRVTSMASAVLLSLAGLMAVLALRRERGRASLWDLTPLVFAMSWIHWWHFMQASGIFLVTFLFLTVVVLSAIHLRFWNSWRATIAVAPALVLLPVNGGLGFIAGTAFLPYVAYCVHLLWRRNRRGDRARAWALSVTAALMIFELAAYVATGLFTPEHTYRPPLDFGLVVRFLQVIAMAAGTVTHLSWNSWGLAIGTLTAATLIAAAALMARDLSRRPSERPRTLGYAAVCAGVALIAAAISISRADGHPMAALSYWYATGVAPLPLALYFLTQHGEATRTRRGLKATLALIALITFVSSLPIGWMRGWNRRSIVTRAIQDAGVVHDPWEIGPRNSFLLRLSPDGPTLGWGLRLLKVMEQGPYDPETGPWLGTLPPMEFRSVPLLTKRSGRSRVEAVDGGRVKALDSSLYLETSTADAVFRLPDLDLVGDASAVVRIEVLSSAASEARLQSVRRESEADSRRFQRTRPVRVGTNQLDFFFYEGEYENREWRFLPGAGPARYRLMRISVLELPLEAGRMGPPGKLGWL